MKRVLIFVTIAIFTQILLGCGTKQIDTIDTYDRQPISKPGSGESVIIRPIAEKYLNDQANNVILKNNIFTHAYGLQFVNILKDSYSKNGYKPIITGNVLKNADDIDSVALEASNNNCQYAMISHINLGKFEINDHVASNLGKSLIPIAGPFVEKSSTMSMSLNIKIIMYDLKSHKVTINKEYSEESSVDYTYTNSNLVEQITKTRLDLYAKLVSDALSKYWNDFNTNL